MDEELLVAIKETCNRRVEEETRRVKQHFEDETRISKKKYKSDVEKLKARCEELIRECEENLQKEYSHRLKRELETQKKDLSAEYDEQLTAAIDEHRKVHESLQEETRISKKKNDDLKKQLKARYESLIQQCHEDLHHEYSMLLSKEVQSRERALISEYELRFKCVIEEHNKKEDHLRSQLVATEEKFRDAVAQSEKILNDHVRQHLNMVSLEAQERVHLDVTLLHEKYSNILREKEDLISSLNEEKAKAVSEYQSLVKISTQQKIEISDSHSKVEELLVRLQKSELGFAERFEEYDHDIKQMILNTETMRSDILSLQKALKTEIRRRSAEKSKFQALEELWSKEKHGLKSKNEEIARNILADTESKNLELNQLKCSLQEVSGERDQTESKLRSALNQISLLEQDVEQLRSQVQHQANAMVQSRQDHEKDIYTLQIRNSDFQRDCADSWSAKHESLLKERNEMQRNLETLAREKEDSIMKLSSLEKVLEELRCQVSKDITLKERQVCTMQREHQEVLSKLSSAQSENTKLKEMVGFMRKDLDLMISLKPLDPKATSSESKVDEILSNILTTVSDKLNGPEKEIPSIQLDTLVSSINNLTSSVKMLSMPKCQEHENRYHHLYSEFLIILEERNRLIEISNQLQAKIQQIHKPKIENVEKEPIASTDSNQLPGESVVQDLAKSLRTNALHALPTTSAIPLRSTDRVTESQRQVRRKIHREQIRKSSTIPSQREISVRNWNKKDD